MIKFIKNIANRLFSKGEKKIPVVSWDEEKIVCSFPNDETKQMKWERLKAVVIETTDEGSFIEDVYFLLFSEVLEGSFGILQCAKGSQELLEKLMKLPGFDEKAVIKAMGCTSNKSFLCWEVPGWAGEEWLGIKAARNFQLIAQQNGCT